MDLNVLQKIGLSQNETKIYFALLKLGQANANEIARETGIHRVSTYDSLGTLREKGLVSLLFEDNKMIYSPADPNTINDLIEQKEKEINNIKELIPELSKFYEGTKTKNEITSFKGLAGVKNIMKDLLTAKTELLDFGAEHWSKVMYPTYYPKCEKERAKNKVHMRIIANERIKGIKLDLAELRFIEQHYTSRVSTYIYNNKVAMIMWSDKPMGVIIQDETINKSYKNYFEFLWKHAKK